MRHDDEWREDDGAAESGEAELASHEPNLPDGEDVTDWSDQVSEPVEINTSALNGDESLADPSGAESFSPEMRELIGRLPISESPQVPAVSPETQSTDLAAITHEPRESNDLGEASIVSAVNTQRNTSPDDVRPEVLRPGDRGAIVQLSERRIGAEPTEFQSSIGALSPPAYSFIGSPEVEPALQMPRLQIVVQLADARAMYESAIDTVLDRNVPRYREIARSEVERGFWWYECQRRAADHRLRGPG